MIQPPPSKHKCKKCGYTKIVICRSDCIDPLELLQKFCPKCDIEMDEIGMNTFDNLLLYFRYINIRRN